MEAEQAKRLGAYLRHAREARFLPVSNLAASVGIDKAQILRVELGTVASPKPDVLARMAKALDLSVADVLTMAGYPTTAELPSFTPYLRARYDLPETAVAEMESFFARLAAQHGVEGPLDHEDEQ